MPEAVPQPASANRTHCIALLGAESTGKSSLALALTAHFLQQQQACALVTEHLREWCEREQRTPRQEEQAHIARQQSQRMTAALNAGSQQSILYSEERTAAHERPIVIADTTALMTAVYSEHAFGDTSLYAQAMAEHQSLCSHTLLMACDLPWVADGIQRTGAHVRPEVDGLLRQALTQANVPFSVIYGQGAQRLRHALTALNGAPQVHAVAAHNDHSPFNKKWRWVCERCSDAECEHQLMFAARSPSIQGH
jgi:nicotinamide riboside kinase